MNDTVTLFVNGETVTMPSGATVAAALLQAGAPSRRSVGGELRQPLCGMGICYECRAEVDGRLHQRTCQILCVSGMQVVTQ